MYIREKHAPEFIRQVHAAVLGVLPSGMGEDQRKDAIMTLIHAASLLSAGSDLKSETDRQRQLRRLLCATILRSFDVFKDMSAADGPGDMDYSAFLSYFGAAMSIAIANPVEEDGPLANTAVDACIYVVRMTLAALVVHRDAKRRGEGPNDNEGPREIRSALMSDAIKDAERKFLDTPPERTAPGDDANAAEFCDYFIKRLRDFVVDDPHERTDAMKSGLAAALAFSLSTIVTHRLPSRLNSPPAPETIKGIVNDIIESATAICAKRFEPERN